MECSDRGVYDLADTRHAHARLIQRSKVDICEVVIGSMPFMFSAMRQLVVEYNESRGYWMSKGNSIPVQPNPPTPKQNLNRRYIIMSLLQPDQNTLQKPRSTVTAVSGWVPHFRLLWFIVMQVFHFAVFVTFARPNTLRKYLIASKCFEESEPMSRRKTSISSLARR